MAKYLDLNGLSTFWSKVKNYISGLKGTVTGTPGAGKTITSYTDEGGKTTVTFGDIAIDASQITTGNVPVTHGGTGGATAADARTNLGVYSKTEVDSMLTGRISVLDELPATGEVGVIYYIKSGTGLSDNYEEYIWDATNNQFIKVGEKSLDLSQYVNTLTKSGSGKIVTGISKSGQELTATLGNLSLEDLTTWATVTDVKLGEITYRTYWPTAPSTSNDVYGITIYNGKLGQVHNAMGVMSIRWYDQDTDTKYTNATLGQGYGTCVTAEATTTKEVTMSGYDLVTGGMVAVKFTNGLCVGATLNINGRGAKEVYVRGAATTADSAHEVLAGDTGYFIYDGTHYQLLGTDRSASKPIVGITRNGTTFTVTRMDGSTDSFTQQDTTYTFDGVYNASTNKAATVSTVTNAIAALDVDAAGGDGKYIKLISETDGKISATAETMDTTPTSASTKAITSGAVYTALANKQDNMTAITDPEIEALS